VRIGVASQIRFLALRGIVSFVDVSVVIDDVGARAQAGEGFLLVMGPDYESVV
jgi:hypothetical protein